MEFRKLGRTDLQVSAIGLGTMTWGEQNTEAEAHQQLDLALEMGVNFIDTAEMYPVPPRAETQGLTESYLGSWLARDGHRAKVLVATKAAGPQRQPHQPKYLRNGEAKHDRKNLTEALEASLRRLRTDHVDLYQLHWPDRSTNTFGRLAYPWIEGEVSIPVEESLRVLQDFIRDGKVRAIGVSNETPWGLHRFLRAAEEAGLPRIATIQNPFSLLNRSFELGLAEFSHREQVGLLAYSPLAFGVLSGKYVGGIRPAASRLGRFERFTRYSKPAAQAAAEEYVRIAKSQDLIPAQMALAFVRQRPFTASVLVGATNLDQLRTDISSAGVELDAKTLEAIDAVFQRYPVPAP